jgi:hypothetical protein
MLYMINVAYAECSYTEHYIFCYSEFLNAKYHYTDCLYMLSVSMLNIVMMSIALLNTVILNIAMLNGVMLSVTIPSVVALRIPKPNRKKRE